MPTWIKCVHLHPPSWVYAVSSRRTLYGVTSWNTLNRLKLWYCLQPRIKPKYGGVGKCHGTCTKLQADSIKRIRRFKSLRCSTCLARNVWKFFQILCGIPRMIGIKLRPSGESSKLIVHHWPRGTSIVICLSNGNSKTERQSMNSVAHRKHRLRTATSVIKKNLGLHPC